MRHCCVDRRRRCPGSRLCASTGVKAPQARVCCSHERGGQANVISRNAPGLHVIWVCWRVPGAACNFTMIVRFPFENRHSHRPCLVCKKFETFRVFGMSGSCQRADAAASVHRNRQGSFAGRCAGDGVLTYTKTLFDPQQP